MKTLSKKLEKIESLLKQPNEELRVESIIETEFRELYKAGFADRLNFLILLFACITYKVNGGDVQVNFDLEKFLAFFESISQAGHYHIEVKDFIEYAFNYAYEANPHIQDAAKKVEIDPDTKFVFADINGYRSMVCEYLHDAGVYKIGPYEFLSKHKLADAARVLSNEVEYIQL